MKKVIVLVVVMLVFASVASALPIISDPVVRAGGKEDNRPIIGEYKSDTSPMLTTLQDGTYIFSDREYTFPSVPGDLVGADYIQTFNSDKGFDGSVTYTVTLKVDCIYAIAVDDRFAPNQQSMVDGIADFAPAGTFTDTTIDLVTGESTPQNLSVFSSPLPAGTYMFKGYGFGNSNNFMVMGAIPEPATLALLGFGGLAMLRRKR